MPSIRITVSADGNTWRADNLQGTRLVNGNTGYYLALTFTGTGWESGQRKAHITIQTAEGETTTIDRSASGNSITLPAMTGAHLLRINIERGSRVTTTPALVFCDACCTDDSGSADTPKPDVYNLMTEYIHRKDIGDEDGAGALLTRLTALRAAALPAFPGDAYRLAAARRDRQTRITGTIKKGSTTQAITEDDIIADSLSIITDIMPKDTPLPGGAPSAELNVELRIRNDAVLEDAEIDLTYHILRHDAIWCDIPLGVFTVASHTQTERGYTVTAYDDMKKLEQIPREDVQYNRSRSNTIREIVQLIVDASGLHWDGVLPPITYAIGVDAPTFEVPKAGTSIDTAWDLLARTLEAVGLVAYVDRNRILRIKNLLRTDAIAEFTPQEITHNDISKTAYKLSYLNTTFTFTDDVDGQTETIRYSLDTYHDTGVTVEMDENPMWNGINGWDRIMPKNALTDIYFASMMEAIAQTTYRPGEISIHGDPTINPMDWITVRLPGDSVQYPVTRSEWRYRGEHKLVSAGREAIAGLAKTQESKWQLAKEERAETTGQMLRRRETIQFARIDGHKGLSGFTHDWLAKFKHTQLGGAFS